MLNEVRLIGNLTKDPETRKTSSGKSVVEFTVATERDVGQKKYTAFANCQAWDHTADYIGAYLKKGSRVFISGYVKSGSYEKNGQKFYRQDVIVEKIKSLGVTEKSHSAPKTSPTVEMAQEPELDITQNQSQDIDYNDPVNDYEDEPGLEIDENNLPF